MLHKNSAPGNIHTLVNWEVADATALGALVLNPSDIYKLAFQLDTGKLLMLTDDSPATWFPVANAAALVLDHAGLTSIGTNTHDDIDSFIASASPILAGLGATYQPLDIQLTDLSGLVYTGNSLKVVRVNAAETGFELATGVGGGGLLSITESLTIAAPNATVNTVNLAVTGGSTNADFVLSPKGTGALLAEIPDNAGSGGNKRGTHAVDFQMLRSFATSVASGANSCIPGGENNRASSPYAFAAGFSCIASNAYAVSIGQSNTASGSASFAVGRANTASGLESVAMGAICSASGSQSMAIGFANAAGGLSSMVLGSSNTATGSYSTTTGFNASDRGLYGAFSHASGAFAVAGSAQTQRSIQRVITTNATPTSLVSNGGAVAANTIYVLPNNSTYLVTGVLVGRNTSGNDSIGIKFEGLISRDASAATTALVAAFTQSTIAADASMAGTSVAFSANTTLGGLLVTVTGLEATTIRWVCSMEATEVA